VQAGSFSNAEHAEWLRAKLQKVGLPVWTSKTTVDGKSFTRVRIGVTTSTADVQDLVDKIRERYQGPAWLAMIENRSEVPSGLLRRTRDYFGS
jgi:cell division protein FtsN